MSDFRLDFTVRDYECDVQGIVNHSNYFHYLEHTRHEFLKTRGIDFNALAQENIYLVVASISIAFKQSLRPNDAFYVTLQAVKDSKLRHRFIQKIFRSHDDCLMVEADVTATCVVNNRPKYLPFLDKLY